MQGVRGVRGHEHSIRRKRRARPGGDADNVREARDVREAGKTVHADGRALPDSADGKIIIRAKK